MTEIKQINLEKNMVVYNDFTEVDHNKFLETFENYWDKRIAGTDVNPFDMERFMKRGSSKNLKQLIDGKKAEGFDEASLGKKVDPFLMKIIVFGCIIMIVVVVAFVLLNKLGIITF